jgi:hypothetical protein
MGFEHVPPPDPAKFWRFPVGQVVKIGEGLDFRVDVVLMASRLAVGTETLDGTTIRGILVLDQPVVIMKKADTGEPMVTLVVRRLEKKAALVQVVFNPKMSYRQRQPEEWWPGANS